MRRTAQATSMSLPAAEPRPRPLFSPASWRLVDQKYGPQGQADYVLYPLAKQVPAAFHDVTEGSNNMPCSLDTSQATYAVNCSAATRMAAAIPCRTGRPEQVTTWQTGLGSVDANALIAKLEQNYLHAHHNHLYGERGRPSLTARM